MSDYILSAKLTANSKDFSSAFDDAEKRLQGFNSKVSSFQSSSKAIGSSMTIGATTPILAAGAASFNMASDLAENMNKADVAFKNQADQVKEWSKTTLDSFGISQSSALDAASLYGDMGTAMGQTTAEASKMSMSLTGLSGDLASFKNISIEQSQSALKGIYTGEGEALKSLGIIMQDSTLEAFALASGSEKSYDAMTQAEKVALRYAFVMDATKNSQGDFARTSDGAANSSRVFGESIKEAGATIGGVLLPIVTPMIQKLTDMVKCFGGLDSGSQTVIVGILALVAAIGPLFLLMSAGAGIISMVSGAIAAMTAATELLTIAKGKELVASLLTKAVYIKDAAIKGASTAATIAGTVATGAATAAQWLLNAALTANPIGIVITLIVLLIAAFVAMALWIIDLWKTNEGFRNAVIGVWENIKGAFIAAWEGIKIAWGGVCAFFQDIWNGIVTIFSAVVGFYISVYKAAWDGVCKIWDGLATFFKGVFDSVFNIVSNVFSNIGSIISNVFSNIQNAWSGLTDFVGGIVGGISDAFNVVIQGVKNAINFVTSGVNSAIDIINMIPGVEIGLIPQLARGTNNFQGGLARINEGGRGELVGLPNGSVVVPHDISMQYARQASQNASSVVVVQDTKDGGVKNLLEKYLNKEIVINLDGKAVGKGVAKHVKTENAFQDTISNMILGGSR